MNPKALNLIIVLPFLAAGACGPGAPVKDTPRARANSHLTISQGDGFLVRNYGGKCLDYGTSPDGVASAVFLNDCNRASPIRVTEVDANHHVILEAGGQVLGIHNPLTIGQGGSSSATAYTLELQNRANPLLVGYWNQIFALDGDSIILASSMPEPQPTPKPVLVVQVASDDGRGWRFSHIMVAPRNLADSEFWDFNAMDGSGRDPTSGFHRVSDKDELLNALSTVAAVAHANGGAAWGNVIKIANAPAPIDLGLDAAEHQIALPTGVTIRGDRRGATAGALLRGNYFCPPGADCRFDNMFQIVGDYVRIAALRLQGPSGCFAQPVQCKDTPEAYVNAIFVGLNPDHNNPSTPSVCATTPDNPVCPQPTGIAIDHNEVFDWPEAINPAGQYLDVDAADFNGAPSCDAPSNPSLNDRVHVDRNFIHHNENAPPNVSEGSGYGVVLSDGATATILGNTFLMNRHSIAAAGNPHAQYLAWGNLVLSNVPLYNDRAQQDFDVHGEARIDKPGFSAHGVGTFAGGEIDILWNTFLGANRANFWLRGAPCSFSSTAGGYLEPVDTFGWNVTMNMQDTVRVFDYCLAEVSNDDGVSVAYNQAAPAWPLLSAAPASQCPYSSSSPAAPYLSMSGNKYVSFNPANRLGVGDFDGDGADDLFLATGSAWFYSPGGKMDWRYLNSGKTDRIDTLLLGDFDADGRTDVVGINPNGQLVVSWGGSADWIVLNSNPLYCSVSDMAVGDFDGDGQADLFCADGQTWRISYGGATPFTAVVVEERTRIKDLRFGDFDGNGTTDVFGIVKGRFPAPRWQLRKSIKGNRVGLLAWQPLPASFTTSIDHLIVADFDGDGKADIADLSSAGKWNISIDGVGPWSSIPVAAQQPECPVSVGSALLELPAPGVGHFAGNKGADFLLWSAFPSSNVCIAAGGNSPGRLGWAAGISQRNLYDLR
jgi:hypothetical protein